MQLCVYILSVFFVFRLSYFRLHQVDDLSVSPLHQFLIATDAKLCLLSFFVCVSLFVTRTIQIKPILPMRLYLQLVVVPIVHCECERIVWYFLVRVHEV